MKTSIWSRAWLVLVVLAMLALLWWGTASAATMLTTQLDFGARGSNVTSLQQFLAADVSVYPEGLVTGYYVLSSVDASGNVQLTWPATFRTAP